MNELWQVTIATMGRQTAFRTEALRRAAALRLARMGAPIVLFGFVDDHTHTVLRLLRTEASRFAQAFSAALTRLCGVRFAPADIRPVNDRRHLLRLVEYILTQPKKHHLPLHCALWAGSCFQDLVGARVIPHLRLLLTEELPRLSISELMQHVGLSAGAIRRELAALGASTIAELADAAVNAVGVPSLEGRRPAVVTARRLTVQLAREAGFTRRELSAHFGWPIRTISRYSSAQVSAAMLLAARVRLALERAAARSAPARSELRPPKPGTEG